ncbi:MAG: hypothetical protein CME70_03020 [Halobacteriovorax sp.]|nr:hypothetical protein [Halobacteriovorax sp.]|tara:strand:+ start:31868 stop:33085 length:1218 start_codon:yes stop_codon:yes gene_type:complete
MQIQKIIRLLNVFFEFIHDKKNNYKITHTKGVVGMSYFQDDYPVHTRDFIEIFDLSPSTPYVLADKKKDLFGFKEIKTKSNTFYNAEAIRNYRLSKTKENKPGEVISFYNRKGGVGKTTLIHQQAVYSVMAGYKVCIIDLDSQANITKSFKIERPKEQKTWLQIFLKECEIKDAIHEVRKNLHLIPANNRLSRLAREIDPHDGFTQFKEDFDKLKEVYDKIFIDCGGVADSTVFQTLTTSDVIISPAFADDYSEEGLELTMEELEKASKLGFNPRHIIVINSYYQKETTAKQYKKLYLELYEDTVARTVIRRAVDFTKATSEQRSLFEFCYDNKIDNVLDDVRLLWHEIFNPEQFEKLLKKRAIEIEEKKAKEAKKKAKSQAKKQGDIHIPSTESNISQTEHIAQ